MHGEDAAGPFSHHTASQPHSLCAFFFLQKEETGPADPPSHGQKVSAFVSPFNADTQRHLREVRIAIHLPEQSHLEAEKSWVKIGQANRFKK